MTSVTKPRLEFIDQAKGICILLVLLWHCMQFSNLESIHFNKFLMSFLMPFYFVVSGMFFKKYDCFKTFLLKKINNLIIPYFFFYVITCILFPLCLTIIQGTFTLKHTIGLFVFWITEHYENQALWFLMCLFNVNVLYYGIIKLSNKVKKPNFVIIPFVFLSGMIGMVLSIYKINFWLMIDSSLTCLPFFYLGSILFKTEIVTAHKYPKLIDMFFAFVIFATIWFFTIDYDIPGFFSNTFRQPFYLVYFYGIVGSVAMLLLSKGFIRIKVIDYIGKNTLVILSTHYVIARYTQFLIAEMNFDQISSILLLFGTTFLISLSFVFICNKFVPQFVSKKQFDLWRYL